MSRVDVLDAWCSARPYDDLLPPASWCVGFDVKGHFYGIADVFSDEARCLFCDSFDLVTVSSLSGTDRRLAFEARHTEQELRELFSGWNASRCARMGVER